MEKLLLNVTDAGQALGLGPTKVKELVRVGTLPSVKIGRARRIPWSAVRAYVEQLQHEHAEVDVER